MVGGGVRRSSFGKLRDSNEFENFLKTRTYVFQGFLVMFGCGRGRGEPLLGAFLRTLKLKPCLLVHFHKTAVS